MSLSPNYQLEEFMRGVERPVPPLQPRPLRAIAEMLVAAWEGLLEDYEEVLRHDEEKVVNTLMESRLKSLSELNPQWSMLVASVERGKETINYDGSKLETRPDFSIYLTNRSSKLPLIVECKLLDTTDTKSKKTINLYCTKGLARFIEGQYGWYAREASCLPMYGTIQPLPTASRRTLSNNKKKFRTLF